MRVAKLNETKEKEKKNALTLRTSFYSFLLTNSIVITLSTDNRIIVLRCIFPISIIIE